MSENKKNTRRKDHWPLREPQGEIASPHIRLKVWGGRYHRSFKPDDQSTWDRGYLNERADEVINCFIHPVHGTLTFQYACGDVKAFKFESSTVFYQWLARIRKMWDACEPIREESLRVAEKARLQRAVADQRGLETDSKRRLEEYRVRMEQNAEYLSTTKKELRTASASFSKAERQLEAFNEEETRRKAEAERLAEEKRQAEVAAAVPEEDKQELDGILNDANAEVPA